MTQPYSTYKHSGIDWLGDIPAHWEVKKLKYVATITLGKMLTPEDKGNYILKHYLRAQNVAWLTVRTEDIKQMWFSKPEMKRFRLEKDDLLVSEGGEVGRTAMWQNEIDECYIQNSVHKVHLEKSQCAKYYLYQFFSLGNLGYFDAIVNRISIAHLTGEKLKEVFFFTPPLSEQTAIANYLDRQTAQIDELVKQKQQLINLLQDERAGLINDAVTQGLNARAPRKDSGLPWLGTIPAHWDVMPFKRATKRVEVGIAEAATQAYQPEGVPILRATNVKNGEIKGQLLYINEEFSKKNASKKIFKDDILTVRTGNAGLSAVIPASLDGCQCFTMLITTLAKDHHPEFYCYVLNSQYGLSYFSLTAWGTAQKNISVPILREMPVFKLPFSEQVEIVTYLETETGRIDATIQTVKQEIDLLTEYRSALISEVVTGKLQVR